MSKELSSQFQYGALGDKDAAGKLIRIAGGIRKAHDRSINSVIEVGTELRAAHEIFAGIGKEGVFGPWVASETPFSRATAYRYMEVSASFADFECVGQFELTGLYHLSSSSVPRKALTEAKKLAQKGVRLSADDCRKIVEKYTVSSTPLVVSETPQIESTTNENTGFEVSHAETLLVNSVSENVDNLLVEHTENCPAGGEHERNEEGMCIKCKDPPEDDSDLATTEQDKPEIEHETAEGDVSVVAAMKEWNQQVNAYARCISEAANTSLKGPWFERSRTFVEQALQSLLGQIRTTKCTHICPKCEGKKCKVCLETGFVPKQVYDSHS